MRPGLPRASGGLPSRQGGRMSIQVGSAAPSFSAPALVGREFKDVTLRQYLDDGKWVVLFFYPKDFTFVCPTEIIAFNELIDDFEDRMCLHVRRPREELLQARLGRLH